MADSVQIKAVLGNARHQISMLLDDLGETAQGVDGLWFIQEALLGAQSKTVRGDMNEYRLPVAIHLGDMFLIDVPSAEMRLLLNEAGEPVKLLVVAPSGMRIDVLGWVDRALSGEEENLTFKYQDTLGVIKRISTMKGAAALCFGCGYRYNRAEVDNGEKVVLRNGNLGTKLKCPVCGAGAYKIGRSPAKKP